MEHTKEHPLADNHQQATMYMKFEKTVGSEVWIKYI